MRKAPVLLLPAAFEPRNARRRQGTVNEDVVGTGGGGQLRIAISGQVTACAGIKPYEPGDHREEGPEKGLFTGSEGEFVIFRRVDEPEADSEAGKSSDETADSEQQKTDNEENKAGIKGDEQQSSEAAD